MQLPLRHGQFGLLPDQQIRRTENRSPRKVPRIHRNDRRFLAVPLAHEVRHAFCVRLVVVDGNEGRGDVGLAA